MKAWLLLVAAFLLWPGCSSQKACEEPDEIDFGEIVSAEKAKYLENDRVQYRCNPSYVLEGPEWIQCNGQKWTPHPPKCLAPCSITRQQLTRKNLFVFGNQRKAQFIQSDHSLQFQCNEGYVLVVPSVRKCVDGYMDLPLCISERGKNCSGPPRTENGDITTLSEKQYRSGSSVEFRCQTYYAIGGQNRSFCNNGTWTKVPICLDPCMIPRTELESQKIEVKDEIGAPENIFVQHGHSIELACRTGYVLAANSSKSAFVIHCDGTPPVFPKCKEITCNSPRISNGTFRPQRTIYHDGDLIRIQCDSGFTFDPDNGEKVVECTKNGWSPPPKCIKIKCFPPEVTNGYLQYRRDHYMYNDEIETICNEGFVFGGPGKVSKCTATGWHPPPVCKQNGCDYIRIENGRMADRFEWYKPFPLWQGQSIEFYCYRGYLPKDKQRWQTARCINSRYDPEPKCFKICDPAQHFYYGHIIYNYYNTYIEGDNVTFVCDMGYSPSTQQSSITCTKKGWSPAPRCIRPVEHTCTKVFLSHGNFGSQQQSFQINAKAKYICHDGYTTSKGETEAETQCLKEGWSPEPECINLSKANEQ
ncbi:complement factor H-like isoform X2 [Pantherophis guttatus]|uniref:Complement factor H-like isoform X2 n=1 Tax=Pantherophis guttatus TaxID=94885 RepID=A0ABM3ZDD4_PANGU|nr:complement factor H-like isoform X2 [Pantherophis guttatus]